MSIPGNSQYACAMKEPGVQAKLRFDLKDLHRHILVHEDGFVDMSTVRSPEYYFRGPNGDSFSCYVDVFVFDNMLNVRANMVGSSRDDLNADGRIKFLWDTKVFLLNEPRVDVRLYGRRQAAFVDGGIWRVQDALWKYSTTDIVKFKDDFHAYTLQTVLDIEFLGQYTVSSAVNLEEERGRSYSLNQTPSYPFLEKLNARELADCVIQCGDGEKFEAHKLILSVCSPVFEAMFRSNMQESVTGCVSIDDMDSRTVKSLLAYIYKGIIEVPTDNTLVCLLNAAEKYGMDELKMVIFSYMAKTISEKNAVQFALAAQLYRAEYETVESLFDFCTRNLPRLEASDELLRLLGTQGSQDL